MIVSIILLAYTVDGEDYLCEVRAQLWLHYSLSMKKSPPPFFDHHFYARCNEAIKCHFSVDLHKDINHTNWLQLYKYLINNVI